jgi:ferrous iron transport protein A
VANAAPGHEQENTMFVATTHHTRPQAQAMPLSMAARGERVVISQIRGGRKLRQRLLDLGLNPGACVRVLNNERHGPLILAVKEDGRLALGRGMAHQIMVTPDLSGR